MNMQVKNTHKPIEYNKSMKILEKRVHDVLSGKKDEFLWIIEHAPVYTAGIRSKNVELLDKKTKNYCLVYGFCCWLSYFSF